MTQKKIGSVAVIGAGIAGIQSSLDLADAGYKVHLVEKSPAIGGVMSSLDKTFPTNDCAMCILSPKLVEVGRCRNVDLITNAEVETSKAPLGISASPLPASPGLLKRTSARPAVSARLPARWSFPISLTRA